MTANRRYREYKQGGGTLSFADYMTREKAKNFVNMDGTADVPLNKPLSDSIANTLNAIHSEGRVTSLENKYIFGIHRNVWIGAAVVTTAVIVYMYVKKQK